MITPADKIKELQSEIERGLAVASQYLNNRVTGGE